MTVEVRPARPDDVAAIVPLMHESSRALIDYSFAFPDEDASAFLARDFLRGRGIFGYENQLVAVEDGHVVATLTAYAGRRASELTLRTLGTAFAHWGLGRFLAVFWRSAAIAPLFIRPRRDALFLANACVALSHRGRGLFSRLFAAAIERREDGAGVVELDVSFSNAPAQRIYEHLGYQVTAERPYAGARKIEGFRRMARAIT